MDLNTDPEGKNQASTPERTRKTVSIHLFKPGVHVVYNSQRCTVHHVMLSRGRIMVKLNELQEPVDSLKLELQPTLLSLHRH